MKLEDHPANFRGENGKPYLVYCPSCGRENWALAVASGSCVWCQWRAEEQDEEL